MFYLAHTLQLALFCILVTLLLGRWSTRLHQCWLAVPRGLLAPSLGGRFGIILISLSVLLASSLTHLYPLFEMTMWSASARELALSRASHVLLQSTMWQYQILWIAWGWCCTNYQLAVPACGAVVMLWCCNAADALMHWVTVWRTPVPCNGTDLMQEVEMDVESRDTATATKHSAAEDGKEGTLMRLYFKDGGCTVTIEVGELATVFDAKKAIEQKTGVPLRAGYLKAGRYSLQEGSSLHSYNIKTDCTLIWVYTGAGGTGSEVTHWHTRMYVCMYVQHDLISYQGISCRTKGSHIVPGHLILCGGSHIVPGHLTS